MIEIKNERRPAGLYLVLIQDQRRLISPVHSFGISAVAEMRDRKEENPASNGDYFLWFIILARLDLNNL